LNSSCSIYLIFKSEPEKFVYARYDLKIFINYGLMDKTIAKQLRLIPDKKTISYHNAIYSFLRSCLYIARGCSPG